MLSHGLQAMKENERQRHTECAYYVEGNGTVVESIVRKQSAYGC